MTPVLRYFKNSYRKKNKHRYSVWTGIPPSTNIYIYIYIIIVTIYIYIYIYKTFLNYYNLILVWNIIQTNMTTDRLCESQYATLINCIFLCKNRWHYQINLNIYRNKNTYTLPLWAQVWRWWCVTSSPAVGSCSGPAAFLCLAPSAYTAAVYRCTSWAWPAGAAEHKADEGGVIRGRGLAEAFIASAVSLTTKGQFHIQLIRKHDRHHKGHMHI